MTPSVRSDRYAILTAPGRCHACGAPIAVSALLVPTYWERDDDEWMQVDDSGLLTYVEALDAESLALWSSRAPWIRHAFSKTAGFAYAANVCQCGALQGDWFLREPDAPFFPTTEAGLAPITVDWIEAPLEAEAQVSRSSWIDALIARSPYPEWTPPAAGKTRRRRSGK